MVQEEADMTDIPEDIMKAAEVALEWQHRHPSEIDVREKCAIAILTERRRAWEAAWQVFDKADRERTRPYESDIKEAILNGASEYD